MIRALIRKDLQLLIAMAVAGTITLLITYGQIRYIDVWVVPVSRGEMIFIAWWICGGALGLVVSTHEEINRTREYLTHRPVTPAQVLTSKLIGCVIVLIIWLISTTVLSIAIEAVFGWNAQLTDLSNLGTLMLLATPAVSLCAAGVFAGTVPAHWTKRIIIAGCTGLVVLLLGQVLTVDPQQQLNDSGLWLLFHAVMTLGLIAASYANVRQTFDPDINVPSRFRTITLIAAVMVTSLAATWGIATVQQGLGQAAERGFPDIVRKESGEFCLANHRRDENRKRYWEEVNTDHVAVGIINVKLDQLPRQWHWPAANGFGTNEPTFNRSFGYWGFRGRAILIQPEGRVYRVTGDRYRKVPARRQVLGKGPAQTPFSRDARVINELMIAKSDERTDTIIVFDSLDGPLWKFSSKPGSPSHFVPVSLPGDVRAETYVSIRQPTGAESNKTVLIPSRGQVVCSATESFIFDGDAFRVAPEWARAEAKRVRSEKAQQVIVTERYDILTPTVRVVEPDSPEKTLFRHEYAAHSFLDYCGVVATLLPSALRAPILQIPSFLQPTPESTQSFGATPYLDPCLAGGRRIWLLLLNLVVSILIAAAMSRRLARRGALSSTRWFWAIAILVAGPTACLILAWTELPRAYRKPDMVTPEQAKPLLIHSS